MARHYGLLGCLVTLGAEMTRAEMRNAKRQLEAALLRAYQSEVTKFQEQTGLSVTSIEIGITSTTTMGGGVEESHVTGIRVMVCL